MRQRAFTLIELLVSLSVLLVVIIATARIFGTTGKVAAIGEASADFKTQLAADPDVAIHLSRKELDILCNLDFHFKQVKAKFKKLGL